MDQNLLGKRTCPECGSADYVFRSRRKIAAQIEKDMGEAVETKYRCKASEHEWTVQVPAGNAGR